MIKIAVLENSFVVVGVFTEGDPWCTIDHAQVVRYWGTTRGLGQIASDGPTATTKLDPTPRQRVPLSKVIKTIECNEEKWRKVLGCD